MSKYLNKSLFLIGLMSLTSLTQQAIAMDIDDREPKSRMTIQPMPTGSIIQFAGSTEPEGWLICDGRTVSRSKYHDLFKVIGKTYTYKVIISSKESEQILGEDTFCIPDMRGRVPVGVDNDTRPHFVTSNRVTSNNKLGESGGEEKHTLTINEMPRHEHKAVNHNRDDNNFTNYAYAPQNYLGGTKGEAQGGDEPHNNMQPYLILNYIIKD